MRGYVLLLVFLAASACKRAPDEPPPFNTAAPGHAGSGSGGVRGAQVAPPADLKTPPADATKTASGLVYKKLVTRETGDRPGRNDSVLVNYTAWRPATGETFFTNEGRGKPMPLNLAQAAPGFVEGLQLLRVGEKAVMWMPAEIGYKSPPTSGHPEALVYQFELVEIHPAPAIPEDVGKPPATAATLKSGIRRVVVRPGTGKDAIRPYDNVTYHFTVWDPTGRMLDSSEARKHPSSALPYKQPPGMTEMLTSMTMGERARFWVDAEKVTQPGGKLPGGVDHGMVCYEIEVTQVTRAAHEPPPTPPDVAKPPAGVQKTAKGVFYRFLAHGPGKDPRHPAASDTVKVQYTGWTTDGRMFDSSYLTSQPATFSLRGVIAGWTDGIPVMTPGDRVRFWIPEELAYKGQAGKPAGMLVFDVELLEIVAGASAH